MLFTNACAASLLGSMLRQLTWAEDGIAISLATTRGKIPAIDMSVGQRNHLYLKDRVHSRQQRARPKARSPTRDMALRTSTLLTLFAGRFTTKGDFTIATGTGCVARGCCCCGCCCCCCCCCFGTAGKKVERRFMVAVWVAEIGFEGHAKAQELYEGRM